jgi:hypothetical protein
MSRPNIILIFPDQWRGDCLGASGHPFVETPFLDELAAEGTLSRRPEDHLVKDGELVSGRSLPAVRAFLDTPGQARAMDLLAST